MSRYTYYNSLFMYIYSMGRPTLMCHIDQWWQSRTVSAVPEAGWISSTGEGSTAFAGPFSPWTKCDCPTSGPGRWWCPGIRMTPLQSQSCSWWWVGESGGGFVLKSIVISSFSVQLQVVKTAPDSQLLNLLFVSRLVTALNEADQCGVICKLLGLDRGVFGCAVVCVQGEAQWGETSLRSSSADRTGFGCVFSQPH